MGWIRHSVVLMVDLTENAACEIMTGFKGADCTSRAKQVLLIAYVCADGTRAEWALFMH